jgi:subtilisin-like proprotein convertase family protein
MAIRRKTRTANTPGAAQSTYTYRHGRRVPLGKETRRFVVRAQPEVAAKLGVQTVVRMSPGSTRVKVKPGELEEKMAASRRLGPTHHAYKRADSGAEFLITDRVLVEMKPDAPPGAVDALLAKYALRVVEQAGPRQFVFQVTDHTGVNPVKVVVALSEQEPHVARAENDLNQRMVRRVAIPADTHYLRAWHLHQRMQHPQIDPKSSSRCEQAWQLLDGLGSPEVVIAMTDDGCRLDHGDFNGAGKFAGWGYLEGTRLVTDVAPDALPAKMYEAGANHGTSCAGVAAGEADGVLTVGAAPGCRLLPVKWESDGPSLFISDSKLLTVLNWIADKADVMSNSWGIVPDNQLATMVTNRITELSSTGGRRGRGIVFLWAAGNENCPIDYDGPEQIPYSDGWNENGQWIGVSRSRRFRNSLVGLPGVMHVAALASNAQRSHYSNYGKGIDITAPTSNSHAFWRMTVPGVGVIAPTGEGQRFTSAFGGTSSATPLTAGVAALVISANPLLGAADVVAILRRTASKDLDFSAYPRTPSTTFDQDTSWDISPAAPSTSGAFQTGSDPDGSWSPWFGFGKVDAERAVAEALARRAPAPSGGVVSGQSAHVVPIPDNQAAGISDTVALTGSGHIGAVKVSVDIAHPYVGDLVVTLASPEGATAVLHQRNGGNAVNLVRSWQTSDTAALNALNGGTLAGNWILRVQDLAAADAGKLRKWSIEVTRASGNVVAVEESPGVAIPDASPAGIVRSLAVTGTGLVTDVAIEVDITHTYIGDLRVALVSPHGQRVVLHDRGGGTADNLIRAWRVSNTAALGVMLGQAAAGTWALEVADLAAADLGKLNRWKLGLTVAP